MSIELPQVARAPFPVDRRDKFIKQFVGPEAGSGVVCFKFWELVAAWGCPFRCAFCFLQALPYARFNTQALMGKIYGNWRRMLDELDEWLTCRMPRMLIVGELQDGLAFDNAFKVVTGKSLTHHLIPPFAAQDRHQLIFLSKSTLIKHALQLEPTPQVVFSWSVNADYASRRWELGAPSPRGRFNAARQMKERGWPIRFRLDPMIPYQDGDEHWKDGYAAAIDRINVLKPEMVTLGTLRATHKDALRKAAEENGRPTDLFDYLSEKDASGFKDRLPFDQQVEMFRFAVSRLDRKRITPALCKEDVSVWDAVGLKFNSCNCLQAGTDVPLEIISTDSYQQVLKGKRRR